MRAKWFLFGIIVTLVVLSAAAYVYFEHGFASTRADTKPGILDSWLSQASESSIERHALKTTNPEPDTYPTLIAAARVYGTRCAICHGSPAQQENQIGEAENPPAPQFFSSSPPNMTESQNYYVIKHGIRMTAMLPWDNLLSDQQIWQVVDLLKHVNNKSVPAEVIQQLNTASVTDVF